ncbi:MAG: hypothetical protein IPK28_10095 [Devosia sp.]|nr:hypothetical protein [Devosia sp.]
MRNAYWNAIWLSDQSFCAIVRAGQLHQWRLDEQFRPAAKLRMPISTGERQIIGSF